MLARLAALAVVGLLACACQVDVRVAVEVADDGSGEVHVAVGLDEDAARRVPDLAEQLQVDDLTEAGWAVHGPSQESDGRLWVRASKAFTSPQQATAVLDEVTGARGPFGTLDVERSRSFFSEDWSLSGEIDLSRGLEGFSDDALRSVLGGETFASAEELERRIGGPLEEAVRVRLTAELPGGGAVWEPELGQRMVVGADTRILDTRRIVLVGLAGAAIVVLVAVLLIRARRSAAVASHPSSLGREQPARE